MLHYSGYFLEETSEIIEGKINKCILIDGVLFLEGWLLPRCNYELIKVSVNEIEVGAAELDKEREDIYNRFPIFNEKKSGFGLITIVDAEQKNEVVVEAYNSGKLVWRQKKLVDNNKVGNVIIELLSQKEYDRMFYIANVLKDRKKYGNELEYFLNYLLGMLDDYRDRISIYQLLYRLGLFNKSYMKKYMEEIEKVEDIWTRLWLWEQDIAWMIFYYPQYAVESIYNWKRDAFKRIAEELRKDEFAWLTLKDNSELSNVAILVEGLADSTTASAILELAIANELARHGYKVKVIVLDTSFFAGSVQTDSIVKRKRDSSSHGSFHAAYAREGVDIHYCKEASLEGRIHEGVSAAAEFHAGLVLDISLDGTVASAILQKQVPVIHITLSGYSSGAVFDAYIAKSRELCREENKIFHSIDESRIYEAPISIPYENKPRKIYYREELGYEDSDFILVTVGHRLKYEMDEPFLETICGFLAGRPSVKWIIVGNDLGEDVYRIAGEMIGSGQIRPWGIEDDLVALYGICDVYLNPKRTGGGGSILLAMKEKLPVAHMNFLSDVMPIIEKKNCCGSSYQDLIEYIDRLHHNPGFYADEGEKAYQALQREDLTLAHYIDIILQAYKDTRKEREQ